MRADRWILGAALALWLAALGRDAGDNWVAATRLPALISETSVEVRDRNGMLLRAYTVENGRWRFAVDRKAVDPEFLRMLIAFEDKRFYRHSGVDPLALARASLQTLWHGTVVSGGSTLTMQVARLLENSGTGQISGKLRQIRLALALERRLSKDQILALYLIHAPYGGNLEGVRAATLAYFGKEPTRLTPAQSALLVALPQAPEARRPDRAPIGAAQARDRVLARMVDAGILTDETARSAARSPVPQARIAVRALAPHLADRARSAAPAKRQHDLTLDATLQTALQAQALRALRQLPPQVSVAMIVADHQTGELLASVGSAAFTSDARQGFVDMTAALRSPGSTLKPLIYALAFDRGLAHPNMLIDDRPVAFGPYAPQNFDGAFRGEVTVADALQLSLNVPVVRLLDRIGPAHLMAALRALGTDPQLASGKAGLAVGLGGVGFTLEDLLRVYAMLAQQGRAVPLTWQKADAHAKPAPPARVLEPRSAWHVAHVLAGLPPPPGAPRMRLAYKTGTSYGHRDAWALGFDGRHVAGVWFGRADGTPVPGAFGGDLAAPELFKLFQLLKPEFDPLPPPPADALVLSTEQLPLPLRRFGGDSPAARATQAAPVLAFPPDGSRVQALDGAVVAKVRDGAAPFTWLVNGAPVATGHQTRAVTLSNLGAGWQRLTVIDAAGRASGARVWLEP